MSFKHTKGILTALLLIAIIPTTLQAASSYPQSQVIKEIQWDFSSISSAAPGSDLWPITWADDNKLYTSWGDGGGFDGSNINGRVTVGVSSIAGTSENLDTKNIFGGYNALTPATFEGKSNGILSVDGILYLSVVKEGQWLKSRIYKSIDHGINWSKNSDTTWDFEEADGAFSDMTFLQFGMDYQDSRDSYVYIYSQDNRASKPRTKIAMFRVDKNKIMDVNSYEYFAGLDQQNNPLWTSNISNRKPVFNHDKGVGFGVRVMYNPKLKRYILTTWHDVQDGSWGIYDSPEPWGPWTTVAQYNSGEWIDKTKKFGFTIPSKWISNNGEDFIMIFSGPNFDSWNTIKGKFTLTSNPQQPPTTPSNVNVNVGGLP